MLLTIAIFILIYLILLGIIFWQYRQLRKLLKSNCWHLYSWAYGILIIGTLVQLSVGYYLSRQRVPPPQSAGERVTIPAPERWFRLGLGVGIPYAMLLMIIAGNHSMHREYETEIKQKNRLEHAMEMTVNSLIVADKYGQILYWNPGAEKMFGYSKAEVIGMNIIRLMPERYRAAHLFGLKRFRETGASELKDRFLPMTALRKDGSEFPIDLMLGTFDEDNEPLAQALIIDTTERKAAEAEKEKTIRQLEKAQRALTSQLRNMEKRAGLEAEIAVASLNLARLRVDEILNNLSPGSDNEAPQ